jgi:hypothetical protein
MERNELTSCSAMIVAVLTSKRDMGDDDKNDLEDTR